MAAKLGAKGVPSRTDGLIGREGLVTFDIDATLGAGRRHFSANQPTICFTFTRT
jgi:hypothetical protein